MFYFFERESAYVRCELRSAAVGRATELRVTEDGQPERVEQYPTWDQADLRWRELQAQFQADGWTGPMGRE
jgi:hypothetical protein